MSSPCSPTLLACAAGGSPPCHCSRGLRPPLHRLPDPPRSPSLTPREVEAARLRRSMSPLSSPQLSVLFLPTLSNPPNPPTLQPSSLLPPPLPPPLIPHSAAGDSSVPVVIIVVLVVRVLRGAAPSRHRIREEVGHAATARGRRRCRSRTRVVLDLPELEAAGIDGRQQVVPTVLGGGRQRWAGRRRWSPRRRRRAGHWWRRCSRERQKWWWH